MLPTTPAAWMSPELLSSRMLPVRREALRVPKLSVRWTVPVSRDAVRSPVLSDSVTVPFRPWRSRVPKESLALTGSPAGTVTPRLSEQVPAGDVALGIEDQAVGGRAVAEAGPGEAAAQVPADADLAAGAGAAA